MGTNGRLLGQSGRFTAEVAWFAVVLVALALIVPNIPGDSRTGHGGGQLSTGLRSLGPPTQQSTAPTQHAPRALLELQVSGEEQGRHGVAPAAGNISLQGSFGPSAGAVPLNVTFTIFAHGGIPPYTFAWVFGDGAKLASLASPNVTHNFVTVGTFVTIVWCNDSANRSANLSGSVVVEAHQLAASNGSATPPNIDLGQATVINVTAHGGTGVYNYSWLGLPPPCVSRNASSIGCTPNVTGVFNVSVVLTDSAFVTVQSSPIQLGVFTPLAAPAITLSSSAVDVGQSLTIGFTTSSTGSGVVNRSWSGLPPGCPAANLDSISCAPTQSGTYSLGLSIRDASGLSATAVVKTLQVSPAAAISAIQVSRSSIDIGQTTVFSAQATGGTAVFTYRWSGLPAGCQSANSSSLSCTPSQAGNPSVSVTATDTNGFQVGSGPKSVSVAPSLTVKVSLSRSQLEIGAQLFVNATPSGGTPAYSFSFTGLPPGCSSSNVSSLNCTPSASGSYLIVAQVLDGAGMEANASVALNLSGSSSPTPGLSPLLVGVGVLVAVGIVAGALLAYRWRKRRQISP